MRQCDRTGSGRRGARGRDQTKSFFQDIAAPEIHALCSDIRRIDEKIDNVDASVANKSDPRGAQVGHTKCELIAEIRRVD